MPMTYLALGRDGPRVSRLGFGCMGMSEFYGSHDDTESLATLQRAIERGVNFLDTADIYGRGHNEELVGRAIQGRREQVVLATKFGVVRDSQGAMVGVSGAPNYVRTACEASLRRLHVEAIDLYYQHRVDPGVPIEDTVGAMAELVHQGKVRYLGLSEAGAETLRRAVRVHPIAALQTEYSLWSRDPEAEILPTCRALGIGFVAYSPLGRGFLTGKIRSPQDLEAGDWRRSSPRFQGENFAQNLQLVEKINQLASQRGCTPGQLALAWLLTRGDDIVPIPGTRHIQRLEENLGSLEIDLTAQEREALEQIAAPEAVHGTRYPEASLRLVSR